MNEMKPICLIGYVEGDRVHYIQYANVMENARELEERLFETLSRYYTNLDVIARLVEVGGISTLEKSPGQCGIPNCGSCESLEATRLDYLDITWVKGFGFPLRFLWEQDKWLVFESNEQFILSPQVMTTRFPLSQTVARLEQGIDILGLKEHLIYSFDDLEESSNTDNVVLIKKGNSGLCDIYLTYKYWQDHELFAWWVASDFEKETALVETILEILSDISPYADKDWEARLLNAGLVPSWGNANRL